MQVHCDPHAANLLIRRTPAAAAAKPSGTTGASGHVSSNSSSNSSWRGGEGGVPPKGSWQLVLLDHGLYRQLPDDFRLEYAGLWHSLVFAGNGLLLVPLCALCKCAKGKIAHVASSPSSTTGHLYSDLTATASERLPPLPLPFVLMQTRQAFASTAQP